MHFVCYAFGIRSYLNFILTSIQIQTNQTYRRYGFWTRFHQPNNNLYWHQK